MVDKAEIAIIKIVGARLAEARQLCKLTLYEAANRLNIPVKQLELIETGTDLERIDLMLVRRASLVFDVSCDFLFAFSDDWEVDPATRQDREFAAYVYQSQTKLFSQWAARQLQLERRVEAMTAAISVLPAEIEAIALALDTFKKFNPDFDRMPAGSPLQNRIERACVKAREARSSLARNKVTE